MIWTACCASFKQDGQTYADVAPIPGAAEKVRGLKAAGHKIIIYTARHMKTCQGNAGLVIARIGPMTLDWLKRHDIPYDEIYFGKPWADVYIDDNAVRFQTWDNFAADGSNLPVSNETQASRRRQTRMTIVIPMAGRGQRFLDAGYRVPKMLIAAHGKSLLQWSVDSLPLNLAARLVFIGLAEHEREFALAAKIRSWYARGLKLEFVFLPDVTGGQAETVLAAREFIPLKEPLLIFNIDTAFQSPTLARTLQDETNDGVLGAFVSKEPRFCFAAVDPTGRVTRVTEKEPISSHALTGLYHYRRAADFLAVADAAVTRNERVKGEFYVAPLYNALMQGRRFVLDACRAHYILGTPAELDFFLNLPAAQVRRDLMASP